MGFVSDQKKPLDQAVELVVFAPIGFALEAKRLLPTFVERGRQQVQMAKMVGQFAVKHGQNEAGRRLGQVQKEAETVLAELGLTGTSPRSNGAGEATPTATPDPASVVTPIRSSAAAASLPIADYDSLAASQVIPRLAGLDAGELAAVRAYEVAHRGRKTILGKVAQLTGE
ncbi:MAG: hypothetical protein JWM89_679 [Acidimicrobiales bacterium]|nr:hypothetical protein [Acidimicrobiales bacterium]